MLNAFETGQQLIEVVGLQELLGKRPRQRERPAMPVEKHSGDPQKARLNFHFVRGRKRLPKDLFERGRS
jgi:hypothetical protein